MATRIKLYRTYRFIDKDPVCDAVRTIKQDTGLNNNQIGALSGCAPGTVHNMLDGETRRPQNATTTAIASALGYVRHDRLRRDGTVEIAFEKAREYDWRKEYERAATWLLKHGGKPKRKRAKKGNGK